MFTGFKVKSTNNVFVPAGAPQELSMTVTPTTGTGSPGGFPWAFFDAVSGGTPLLIGDTPANTELVQVIDVSPATNSFTAKFSMSHTAPATVAYSPYFGYPTYPSGYNNTLDEPSQKGIAFNVFSSSVRVGPSSSFDEALIRFGGTNSPAVTSEIFRLMPVTFSDIRARNMVTLWSMHWDRVCASPYIPFDPLQPGHYQLPNAATYPTMVQAQYAAPDASKATPLPATSEYGRGDWRSTLGQKLRVNLNRSLATYPAPDQGDFISTAANQVKCQQAVADRQEFAWDIYNALVRVTGAQDPNVVAGMVNTSDEYKAARWLAQLAVNIVDYIDEDNNITPFNWYPAAKPAADGWVFGTEQPALVLNEVYAQQEPGRLNVWLELHNPFLDPPPAVPEWDAKKDYNINFFTPTIRVSKDGNVYIAVNSSTHKDPKPPPDRDYWVLEGTALLAVGVNGASPVYKVEIHRDSLALTTAMRDPANHQGVAPNPPPPLGTQSKWALTMPKAQVQFQINPQVKPASGAFRGGTLVTKKIAAAPTGATEAKVGAINVVTITTTAPHGFSVGQAVTIAGITGTGALGYNGTFNIESIIGPPATSTSFTYNILNPGPPLPPAGGGSATFVANGNTGFFVAGPQNATYTAANRVPNLPATFVSPQMSIITPSFDIKDAPFGAKISGTTVTITTKTSVGTTFKKGDSVTISGVRAPDYNGTWTITSISLNSFTFEVPNLLAKKIALEDGPSGGGTASASVQNITLLLRRLANPRLPVNPNPGPLYNPYITVDYLVKIPVNIVPVPATGGAATFKSFGRKQPYTAQFAAQNVHPPGPPQPFNTFFTQNSNASTPFTWLTHLDRPLVNPLELMHVSAFKPHELTQQFITPAGGFQHYAKWNNDDPKTLLYRALDVLGTPSHIPGTVRGGRLQGSINLNTITEPEIFQALCDSQDWQRNPLFKTTNVGSIFDRLIASRNPRPAPTSPLLPSDEGNPFQPFAAGDINKTWFRLDPATGKPLFAVGATGAHPYARQALLQKIFNNITTTSNVFGVWWTVGYFEVVDESVRPAKLGKEIGRAENRHMRHRFFAVVDRSGLELFRTSSASSPSIGAPWNSLTKYLVGAPAEYAGLHYQALKVNTGVVPPSDPTTWTQVKMFYHQQQGSANGVPFTIEPGMLLDINSQMVSVQTVGADPPRTVAIADSPQGATIAGNTVTITTKANHGLIANEMVTITGVGDAGYNGTFPVTGVPSQTKFTYTLPLGRVSGPSGGGTVTVSKLWFTGDFPIGTSGLIICRGNPGPRQAYNPRRDSNVVLYMTMIQ
jgi:hypothetical protein